VTAAKLTTAELADILNVPRELARAREVLAEEMPEGLDYGETALWHAQHSGRIEHHLGNLIALLEQVTQ
jgi:hypothetical protein